MEQAAKQATQHGKSWTDYTVSFYLEEQLMALI